MGSVAIYKLATGEIPGITSFAGGCLAEAACICLEDQKHTSGVRLSITGAFSRTVSLEWESATDQMRRCWANEEEATELGACGIAVLLILHLTDFTVVERSYTGTGFDYWLGSQSSEDPLFQNKARLEVSGIRKGTNGVFRRRVDAKVNQTKQSDGALPAYIIVVEFSVPRSQVVKR